MKYKNKITFIVAEIDKENRIQMLRIMFCFQIEKNNINFSEEKYNSFKETVTIMHFSTLLLYY